MGSNPVEASDFFLGFLCNCLSYFTTAKITFASNSLSALHMIKHYHILYSNIKTPERVTNQKRNCCKRKQNNVFCKVINLLYFSEVRWSFTDSRRMKWLFCLGPRSLHVRDSYTWIYSSFPQWKTHSNRVKMYCYETRKMFMSQDVCVKKNTERSSPFTLLYALDNRRKLGVFTAQPNLCSRCFLVLVAGAKLLSCSEHHKGSTAQIKSRQPYALANHKHS